MKIEDMPFIHGTSDVFLPDILEHGLQPRGARPSHYEGEWVSASDRVYLADGSEGANGGWEAAWYAAKVATKNAGGKMIAVEVRLKDEDQDNLVPDEDATKKYGGRRGLERQWLGMQMDFMLPEAKKWLRDMPDWLLSMLVFDSFAHVGPIPASRIVKVHKLDPRWPFSWDPYTGKRER